MITQPQNLKGPQNPRYKTSLCKNFLTESGCQYGEKCQFAHGKDELRPIQSIPQQPAVPQMKNPFTQLQKNMMNFKIVKCKNFEKEGQCKYGDRCTFAHGDAELRIKSEPFTNQQFMQLSQNGQMPMMMQGYFDYQMLMMNNAMQGMAYDYSQIDPNLMMQQNPLAMMPTQTAGNAATQMNTTNTEGNSEQQHDGNK